MNCATNKLMMDRVGGHSWAVERLFGVKVYQPDDHAKSI